MLHVLSLQGKLIKEMKEGRDDDERCLTLVANNDIFVKAVYRRHDAKDERPCCCIPEEGSDESVLTKEDVDEDVKIKELLRHDQAIKDDCEGAFDIRLEKNAPRCLLGAKTGSHCDIPFNVFAEIKKAQP